MFCYLFLIFHFLDVYFSSCTQLVKTILSAIGFLWLILALEVTGKMHKHGHKVYDTPQQTLRQYISNNNDMARIVVSDTFDVGLTQQTFSSLCDKNICTTFP